MRLSLIPIASLTKSLSLPPRLSLIYLRLPLTVSVSLSRSHPLRLSHDPISCKHLRSQTFSRRQPPPPAIQALSSTNQGTPSTTAYPNLAHPSKLQPNLKCLRPLKECVILSIEVGDSNLRCGNSLLKCKMRKEDTRKPRNMCDASTCEDKVGA